MTNTSRLLSHDRKLSRSRSRSRSRSSKPTRRRQWRSANAFLNFMQDFRQVTNRKYDGNNVCERYVSRTDELQNYNKMKSSDLFRLGGQEWRRMSSVEKMPYVEAAKLAQQQSQQNNKNAQQNKPNSNDSSKKPENQRNPKKKEREVRPLHKFSLTSHIFQNEINILQFFYVFP